MPIKPMEDCKDYSFRNICKNSTRQKPMKIVHCIGKKCPLYQTKFTRLIVSCEGDSSVGIWGDQSEVLIERRFVDEEHGYTEENRKWIKEQFQTLFRELFDDPSTRCQFEDECYGCGRLKTDCVCPKEM